MNIIPVQCSFDNYSYLMICPDSFEAAVVDPTEAYPLLQALEKSGARLTSVLCTHHHHDHIGGVEDLLQEYPGIPIFCHDSDMSRIPFADTFVRDGDSLHVGNLHGKVYHTPGHTSGSICYHFEDVLFSGDTLFGGGCGRLFEGTPEQMYTSLTSRISVLKERTRIYFGHEYTTKNLEFATMIEPDNVDVQQRLMEARQGETTTPSTLALEQKTNPFLRADAAEIRLSLERQKGVSLVDAVEVFTLLRELRNTF